MEPQDSEGTPENFEDNDFWPTKVESEPTTHNFGDGRGEVPAHRHPNGGGWVADTAFVSSSAYISATSEVYGEAIVSANAQVNGHSSVYGQAYISTRAFILDDSEVYGTAKIEHAVRISNRKIAYGTHYEEPSP